jgi:hypothetical protein
LTAAKRSAGSRKATSRSKARNRVRSVPALFVTETIISSASSSSRLGSAIANRQLSIALSTVDRTKN